MTHHHWWALLFRNLWQLQCWPQPRCRNKNKCLANASSLSSRFWRVILLSISRWFSTWESKLGVPQQLLSSPWVAFVLPQLGQSFYTCSPTAPAQWVGGQDHRNAAGDRQRRTAPHARGSCQSSGKGSACTADSITQDKYLNANDERNLLFVGGWSCDCTASPSNENWSLQEIGWDERILHNLTCHSLSCYTFGAIKMITVRIEV